MTLVPSAGWIAEALKMRAKRDEVRARFREKIGIEPIKSYAELSLSPAAQQSVVQGLLGQANKQSSPEITHALAALSSALSASGLGTGGAMADAGTTALDFLSLTPLELAKKHFLERG